MMLPVIDYAYEGNRRREWLAWLQAKAAERRLSDPDAKVEA